MEQLSNQAEPRRVRSLFVSDLHLGSPFSKAEEFLDFLENYHPDYLYIVGDFIDGWSLQRSWRWTPHYSRILHHLFAWAVDGVRIRYTPGNHDAFLRGFLRDFGWVEVADEFVHRGADRRRYLVTHGDQFDDVEARAPWLSKIGSIGYDLLLCVDRLVNWARSHLGLPVWRLSATVKSRVKQAVAHVSHFEQRLAEHSRNNDCHGIICGHVHTPTIARRGEFIYCNTGDWVENCSGLVELHDGRMHIVRYLPAAAAALGREHQAAVRAPNADDFTVAEPPTALAVASSLSPDETDRVDLDDQPPQVRMSAR